MIPAQQFVGDMCESIHSMKLTQKQSEFAKAVMRAAIEYANAKNQMTNSREGVATASSLPSTTCGGARE